MANPTQLDSCPCKSGLSAAECCLPFIQGKKKPVTAEELLRSRYTGFVVGNIDYILKTHHSKTAHEVKRDEIEEWSKQSEWQSLEVFQKEAGEAKDERGTIIFCAKFKNKAKADAPLEEHWEQSFFEKENGEWKFLDARGVHQGTYKREAPKTGRNDPCSCGSGKKFKKCCG